jgi:CO/xanthine dehydrogenase Mo-binding subunit
MEQDILSISRGGEPESLTRRTFVKLIGTGVLISVSGETAYGQRAPRQGQTVSARLHIGKDGAITVMTGKVEVGQGSRAEISQAAAEELRVPLARIELVMADTEHCPDDGVTAGSGTTPRTLPAVRKACAAAREVLIDMAARRWQADRKSLVAKDGAVVDEATKRTLSYAELASGEGTAEAFDREVPSETPLTPVREQKVLGTPAARPNLKDLVTGAHRYPSDTVRPGMLYGKVLRPPAYGAKLKDIDLAKAKALEGDGVVVVRDGDFVGCAAPTTYLAARGLEALAAGATWETADHPSSDELYKYLKDHSRRRGRTEPDREKAAGDSKGKSAKSLHADYQVAYIQHAPMETRGAVAEWTGDKLTVWTGSQAPFRVRSDLAQALRVPEVRVRVVIPDTGGGFGGKHSGECAVEAARLAKAAAKPVSLRWTRQEEFTWAYFRPAGLIEIQGGLDDKGVITAWDFTNYNSGGSAVESPYAVPGGQSRHVPCDTPPLKQGSYRALASTANNFARECFVDELAAAAGADPLAFRLAHLQNQRLRNVLEAAAKKFGWAERAAKKAPDVGFGLACGTEKGSYVAACAEVSVDRKSGAITVRRVAQAFECGAIQNPQNLHYQVQGAIIMGLGGALIEEIRFAGGKLLTDRFSKYRVPRMRDVPPIEIELLDRPDLAPAGGGETPIIAIAPALGNAVFDATGVRIRSMPLRDPALKKA